MARLKMVIIEGDVDGETIRQLFEQFAPPPPDRVEIALSPPPARRPRRPHIPGDQTPPPADGGGRTHAIHWTQRPENQDKVRAMTRRAAATRYGNPPPVDPPTPVAPAAGDDTHEARPRSRGDLGPINPRINGAAARITHAEVKPRGPAVHVRKSDDEGSDGE
jgi:hypothetical protein